MSVGPSTATTSVEGEALISATIADQQRRRADAEARSSMWRTHHWPDQYDRCATVRGKPFCRRCLALHPLALFIAVMSAAGFAPWPTSWDPWAIWLLSVPATIDFIVEQLQIRPYSPKRQVAATLITAFAFGRALGYELVDRWSLEFWGPIAVFGGLWFAVAVLGGRRREAPPVVDSDSLAVH